MELIDRLRNTTIRRLILCSPDASEVKLLSTASDAPASDAGHPLRNNCSHLPLSAVSCTCGQALNTEASSDKGSHIQCCQRWC